LLRRLLAIVCLAFPVAAAAEPLKLGGPEIKETFTGSLLELDTPLGTTIPIRFTGDGLMTGKAGSLASVLGAAHDRGRWWVKGDRLCYKWFRWFDAQEQCLTIRLKSERVYWLQDDGKRGTATIIERPEIAVVEPPKVPVRVAESAPSAPTKTGAKAPVLKSPPKLAVRPPKSPAEELGVDPDGVTDRSLFFVGLGLSRALRSHYEIASVASVPLPVANTTAKVTAKSPASARKPDAAKPDVAKAAVPNAAAPSGRLPSAPSAKPARTVVATADPATAVSPGQVSFSVYGVDDDDVLNMRSGPSEAYAIVGVIPSNGSGVRMVGPCVGLWCQIQFRGVRGWANRYYLAQN
jgi:SH3-like domain-containing protein